MTTLLTKLLEQLNSSVFVLMLVLVVVAWSLYKLGSLKEKFCHHEKRLDNADRSHDLLVALSTKIDFIYDFTNPRSLARSQSPVALTPLGTEVSEKIKADEIFARHAGSLSDEIASQCPTEATAYDIQVASLKIAKTKMPEVLSANEINLLKKVAFEYGIILDDMWIIFGILLRDKTLNERGIPVAEVDRHTPA